MGYRPFTRFVIEAAGELKRVISVREVTDGRLIINTRVRIMKTVHDGGVKHLVSSKITVHPSSRSSVGENNIHTTEEFDDGSTRQRSLQTSAIRDGRFQMISTRTMPDPRLFPSLEPHNKDTLIRLPSFDPSINTLHYGIWVCASDCVDDFIPHPFYSAETRKFSRFGLILPFCFTYHTSTGAGHEFVTHTMRDETISEEQRGAGYTGGPSTGREARDIWLNITRAFNLLASIPTGTTHFPILQPQSAVKSVTLPPLFHPAPKSRD